MRQMSPDHLGWAWFRKMGWKVLEFQQEAWSACGGRESGLIHAPTGSGKTHAVWLGILDELARNENRPRKARGLRVLWLTPLRALAADTAENLRRPVEDLGLPFSVEVRNSDTSASLRARQRKELPHTLITTPESLSLLLSYADSRKQFAHLDWVVVDEWHELLGSKRGVQSELALARLRHWAPALATWGLSATLGNLNTALQVLLGTGSEAPQRILRGFTPRPIVIESLLPERMECFPWTGHLGFRLLPQVLERLESCSTTLLFTNTRSQAEAWFQAILSARPNLAGEIAIHHGSLDRDRREWVETALRQGRLRCVVCTSTLDLGVDFSPVERVMQVGSCKGIGRLMQRAGRSGHRPGRSSHITYVPTHALELIEIAAIREALSDGKVESRFPVEKPLDLLVQHITTIAAGGGFTEEELYREIRSTYSYRHLTPSEWQWALDFVTRGGKTLGAYPQLHRVTHHEDRYVSSNRKSLQRHRLSIGTITSDGTIPVRYRNGRRLGQVEESFLSRLDPGDRFTFAGKILELIHIRDSIAWVKRTSSRRGLIPRWMGGRMPLSTQLAEGVRKKLEEAEENRLEGPEMRALQPILNLQCALSIIPRRDEFLIERVKTREGFHLFFFPFCGRLVHEGLSALFAHRLAGVEPITFSLSVNDYGFELLSPTRAPDPLDEKKTLLGRETLLADIRASLNATQMAKQQFREIARVSGLTFDGYPGRRKTSRQLQLSSGLLYDVFRRYDPENLLLHQAEREVLENQLEESRLHRALCELDEARWKVVETERPTPFAFPLLVSRLRQSLSSEELADRIRKMTVQVGTKRSEQSSIRGR